MRCINHSDRITTQRCVLCERPFCEACLTPSAEGPACERCREALVDLPPPPPEAPPLAPRLAFDLVWGALVLLPLVVAGVWVRDVFALKAWMSLMEEEPRRLGDIGVELVELGALAERGRLDQGEAWDGAEWRAEVARHRDPWSAEGAPYQISPREGELRLCSVGPDHTPDAGAPLDRFTGAGDVCIHLRAPVAP